MSTKKKTDGPAGRRDMTFGLPTPQLDHIPDAVRPVCELGMKVQSDTMELWSHRARAWMDWPETLSTCKTFDDLTRAQGEYLARMQKDYAHFTDGMLRHLMIEQDTFEEQDEQVPPVKVAKDETPPQKAAA